MQPSVPEISVSDTAELRGRLVRAAERAADAGIDALLISPGPDLRYLTGYHAHALERLTCLIVPADGPVRIVVPRLEAAAALATPIAQLDIEVIGWGETEDPFGLVARLVPSASRVAVDDRMWAVKALALRDAMPEAQQVAAGVILQELRMRKTPAEVAALQRAGAAIDAVHAMVPQFLRAGRTEAEVGRDLAAAISLEHETVDFIIVGSGPNGASPHHTCSERVIRPGDVVVVDIGGTTPEGYCSDSTRTYAVGEPAAAFVAEYQILKQAQRVACESVRPSVSCESIDAAARDILAAAGLGELFIHRTGHGIGIETHEEPYIVQGNARPIEPGMAFSVEPGFYREGTWGSRIEDILVCTEDGFLSCNNQTHELVVV